MLKFKKGYLLMNGVKYHYCTRCADDVTAGVQVDIAGKLYCPSCASFKYAELKKDRKLFNIRSSSYWRNSHKPKFVKNMAGKEQKTASYTPMVDWDRYFDSQIETS